jgi:hypothetical protein
LRGLYNGNDRYAGPDRKMEPVAFMAKYGFSLLSQFL